MKGATEELFVKVTYYKKRKSLGSPQWHFTMHIPQCFSQKKVVILTILRLTNVRTHEFFTILLVRGFQYNDSIYQYSQRRCVIKYREIYNLHCAGVR